MPNGDLLSEIPRSTSTIDYDNFLLSIMDPAWASARQSGPFGHSERTYQERELQQQQSYSNRVGQHDAQGQSMLQSQYQPQGHYVVHNQYQPQSCFRRLGLDHPRSSGSSALHVALGSGGESQPHRPGNEDLPLALQSSHSIPSPYFPANQGRQHQQFYQGQIQTQSDAPELQHAFQPPFSLLPSQLPSQRFTADAILRYGGYGSSAASAAAVISVLPADNECRGREREDKGTGKGQAEPTSTEKLQLQATPRGQCLASLSLKQNNELRRKERAEARQESERLARERQQERKRNRNKQNPLESASKII